MDAHAAGLRGSMKRVGEVMLVGAGVVRAAERRSRHRTAILSYHNIVPEGESVVGDASLHLPRHRFCDHLDVLQRHYEIVSLDRLALPSAGQTPRVAITLDDAYAGAVSVGVDELASRGLPATLFVSAGMLDRRSFWWDRLAGVDGIVASERRAHALWALAGDDDAVRGWMRAESLGELDAPEHALSATEAELDAATSQAGVTLGAHGWRHLNFAALDEDRLAGELDRPARALKARYEAYRPWVAFPYGLASASVEAASASMYQLGFGIEGGPATSRQIAGRPAFIPRINVPAGLSVKGLRLRVAGVIS